jgi:hypothetical protein
MAAANDRHRPLPPAPARRGHPDHIPGAGPGGWSGPPCRACWRECGAGLATKCLRVRRAVLGLPLSLSLLALAALQAGATLSFRQVADRGAQSEWQGLVRLWALVASGCGPLVSRSSSGAEPGAGGRRPRSMTRPAGVAWPGRRGLWSRLGCAVVATAVAGCASPAVPGPVRPPSRAAALPAGAGCSPPAPVRGAPRAFGLNGTGVPPPRWSARAGEVLAVAGTTALVDDGCLVAVDARDGQLRWAAAVSLDRSSRHAR